mmetsp:Transcript_16232/g.42544  ORF Transcript_16232/g.42544 Transcript_16232/m.42544 type:complete len:193 (-) Transcript_16232:110-688(-)
MGQGQSGDHLAVAVLSHVVQSGRAELMAMRRHMADSSKRNHDGLLISRKHFHAAESAVTVDESDRDIYDRLFTLFDKTGGGQVLFKDFIVGLTPIMKGSFDERLLCALQLYDMEGTGMMNQTDIKMVFRSMNHTAGMMGDPTLVLDQLDELVETVFVSIDEELVVKGKIKYEQAIQEFRDHPIIESYLARDV